MTGIPPHLPHRPTTVPPGLDFLYINGLVTTVSPDMLKQTHPSLPASWYFDPAHFQLEMEQIWWKEWLCVGRESEWPETGSYRRLHVGNQQIIVTRNQQQQLNAFHNTCRHRGSLLCETDSGTFSGGRLVCPYHAWTYSLDGKLTGTPRKLECDDFRPEEFSLYPAALRTWGGFVFINLDEQAGTVDQNTVPAPPGQETDRLSNWPLNSLALAHSEKHLIDCNWKIFWENYLECYHCPNIHHDLCSLVPLYKQGMTNPADAAPGSPGSSAQSGASLAPGAVTWSHDGQTALPWFKGLSESEQSVGMTFCDFWPSVFIVAHVDYVRSVHVMPIGPERTQLTINWMLEPETLANGNVDIPGLISFGRQVVLEDGRVCKLNQQGLHSIRHRNGVLVPQEEDVLEFDNWVRARLTGRE